MGFDTSRRSRRWMSSAATGLALAMLGMGAAYAQDVEAVSEEEEAQLETIVVTGFRAALASAAETKRASTSIVEAISAEDIGKLPDASITESLARLPGLAAQRLRGRAQVISVRGLGPDYTTALLNGREQVTAGDNRGVEFDQYPSELLSKVLVYKTPDAALIGQGLAGTADLQTLRPLAFGKKQFAASARYEVADIGALNKDIDDTGYRLTGFYVDQFANNTIGLAIGISTQSTPNHGERWEAWGYPEQSPGVLVIGGAKPYVESRTLERDAIVGTLEFQPTNTFSTTVDAFYSKFTDDGVLRGIELPLFWSGAQLQPGFTVEDGLITQGQFNGVKGVVRNDFRGREAKVLSLGWNAEWQFAENYTLELDLSRSSVERNDIDIETYSGTGRGANGATDNLAFRKAGDGGFTFTPQLNYADPTTIFLTDPGGWGQVGFIKEPSTDDELNALRISVKRDFGPDFWISSVELGANFSEREKSKRSVEAFIDLANPGATGAVPIPAQALIGSTELAFLGIPGMVSYDPVALFNSGIYSLRPNLNADVITKSWDVTEEVAVAYVKFDVDTTFMGKETRGNFGLQVVQTDQSSTGSAVRDGNIQTFTEGDDYINVLPSLNLSFEVADDTFVRVGVARTLARPRMDDLSASQSFGVDTTYLAQLLASGGSVDNPLQRAVFAGGGGNPTLRPYIADGFDISFERYFGRSGGYVSVALFHKEIDNWIIGGQPREVDYSQIVPFFETAFPGISAIPDIGRGRISGPDNVDGGWLQGIELAATVPFDLFTQGPLSGFGVSASVSLTDSEIQPPGSAEPIKIPGLSETVGNLTVFYENQGFEARVSNRYRSDFLGDVIGFGAGQEFRDVKGESVIDAQIGYRWESGRLNGVAISLQGLNLSDESFTTTVNGDDRAVRDYQNYGRTFLFGITYRR
jgi:iron complex outermembrane recepter protein